MSNQSGLSHNHHKSSALVVGSVASRTTHSKTHEAADGLWTRLLLLLILTSVIAIWAAPAARAEDAPTAEAGSCAQMLTLFGVESRGDASSPDMADRCGAPVNIKTLLMASPVRAAREESPVVCVPPDSEITLGRVAEIFYGFGSQYLETLYENPYALLIEALEEEFPCGASVGQVSSAG